MTIFDIDWSLFVPESAAASIVVLVLVPASIEMMSRMSTTDALQIASSTPSSSTRPSKRAAAANMASYAELHDPKKRGAPGSLSAKCAAALEMVASGEVRTQKEAARKLGIHMSELSKYKVSGSLHVAPHSPTARHACRRRSSIEYRV